MYTYRLLSFPEDHPTKGILPVSFRKGDGDTQPGEQPANTLLWASSDKASTYGQWLARQIFLTKCRDPTDGVEPVKIVWRCQKIPIQVIIEPAEKAVKEAKNPPAGKILWTDGSKLDSGKSGAGVVWKDLRTNKWQQKRHYLGTRKEPYDAELWALSDALEIAIKETRNTHNMTISIFTDSKAAMEYIRVAKSKGLAVRDLINQRANELQTNGHSVILRWVPGHLDIEGN